MWWRWLIWLFGWFLVKILSRQYGCWLIWMFFCFCCNVLVVVLGVCLVFDFLVVWCLGGGGFVVGQGNQGGGLVFIGYLGVFIECFELVLGNCFLVVVGVGQYVSDGVGGVGIVVMIDDIDQVVFE